MFALIYWLLPDTQFRIPDGSGTDFGSWLYYSIVTISTIGFGDYTPAHVWAQLFTALEVLCGLSIFGFFLNAVGSMKSEIDLESEVEKQRLLHHQAEKDKLLKAIPVIMHNMNMFLTECYYISTPVSMRSDTNIRYNPDFKFQDLRDLYVPMRVHGDIAGKTPLSRFMASASYLSLALDSLQTRIDLSLWPELLEGCFSFVATCQLFRSNDELIEKMARTMPGSKSLSAEELRKKASEEIASWKEGEEPMPELAPYFELYSFIKENASTAARIEKELTVISSSGTND